MSVCGQSGQTEEDSASEEVGASVREKSDIYKQKPASKVVRVLTVLAYLLSVSLAAILLSVYYICVWKSPDLPRNDTPGLSALQGNHSEYKPADYAGRPFYNNGGSDIPMNDSTINSPTANITSGYADLTETDTTTYATDSTTVDLDSTPQELFTRPSDDIGPLNETDNNT